MKPPKGKTSELVGQLQQQASAVVDSLEHVNYVVDFLDSCKVCNTLPNVAFLY